MALVYAFLLFWSTVQGVSPWPPAFDSYAVTVDRFPFCNGTTEITQLTITDEGAYISVEVLNASSTDDYVAIVNSNSMQNCSNVPTDLGAPVILSPSISTPLNRSIYSLSTSFAVVLSATEGRPLACAPMRHPNSGTYGFGADVSILDEANRPVAFFMVLADDGFGPGNSLFYGTAMMPLETISIHAGRCGDPNGETLSAVVLAQEFPPVINISIPLQVLSRSASVVVSWNDARGKVFQACGNISIGDPVCLDEVKELPFLLFIVPFVAYLPLLLLWALCKSRACCHHKYPVHQTTDGQAPSIHFSGAKEDGSKYLLGDKSSPYQQQWGYRSTCFGQFLLLLYVLLTLWITILIIFICLDYYGATWYGVARCMFGNSALEWWMFGAWFFHAFWYGFLASKYYTVRNFFRWECALADAEEIMMWRPKEVENFVDKSHPVMLLIRRCAAYFGMSDDGVIEFVKVQKEHFGKYIVYQYQRYLWNEEAQRFVPQQITLPTTHGGILALSSGLTHVEAEHRRQLLGPNAIPLTVPSWLQVAGQEFCSIFYVYQYVMIWRYYYWDYWQVALPFTLLVVLSGLLSMWVLRSNAQSLAQLAKVGTVCWVRRGDSWIEADSSQLVPGDVIEIPGDTWVVPCDAVIVSGTCLMDESGLTGESMPQQKEALTSDDPEMPFQPEKGDKKHCLYAGTICLRSTSGDEDVDGDDSKNASERGKPARAVILTTGLNTSKGKLLASILWPKELRFKFDEHAVVVIFYLCCFAVFVFTVNTIIGSLHSSAYASIPTQFLRASGFCCQILSPLIPALLVVGQTAAASRLRSRDIFCINPRRMTMAGKIKCMCFDKTGTLTKSGLDFMGPCPMLDKALAPHPVPTDKLSTVPTMLLHSMVSCHTVTCLDGRLVGKEVEVKMFEATGWQIEEDCGHLPKVKGPDGTAITLLRRFEFDHNRMAMTVVTQFGEEIMAFTKGGFERIQSLCRPEAIPGDYHVRCQEFAAQGFYTLAIGYKPVASVHAAAMLSRDELECDLQLLGLLLFRNEPKPDAAAAVVELKKGATRVVMITGDTVLTGIAVARSIELLAKPQEDVSHDKAGDGSSQPASPVSFLSYSPSSPSDNPFAVLVDASQGILEWFAVGASGLPNPISLSEAKQLLNDGSEAAMTGTAYEVLGPDLVSDKYYHGPGGLLLVTRVFGRMSPEQKIDCVKRHMAFGLITGMCGDGGNDAGALRVAHAGIALSDTEASIVSPFTSKSRTVMSVVDVMREGRCALCTSFAAVKYQIMYGAVLGFNEFFESYYQTLMGAWHWMYLDGVVSLFIAVALIMARPEKSLAPTRPTASLLAPIHVISCTMQMMIHMVTTPLVLAWCRSRDFFVAFDATGLDEAQWWKFTQNYEGSVIFVLTCAEVLAAGAAFSLGGVYRSSLLCNWPFLIIWGVVLGGVCILLVPNNWWWPGLFKMASSEQALIPCGVIDGECYDECLKRPHVPMPQWFCTSLLCVCLLNISLVMIAEKLLLLASVSDYWRSKFPSDRTRVRI